MRILSSILGILLIVAMAGAEQLDSGLVAAHENRSQADLFRTEMELQACLKLARGHGTETVEVARAFARLGVFYQDVGRFPEAESSLLKSLKILTQIRGRQDESQVPLISHLAWLYVETGRTEEAKRLHLDDWAARLAQSRSEYLPAILETVGGLYALEGNFTMADETFHRDFDLLAERGAALSVDMASALNNFGFIQLKGGRYDDALQTFLKALPLWTNLYGFDDLQVAITRVGLAETYARLGRFDESSVLFIKALPIFEQRCGPGSLRTADVLNNFAKVLQHQKRKREAKQFEDRASRILAELARGQGIGALIDVHDLTTSRRKNDF